MSLQHAPQHYRAVATFSDSKLSAGNPVGSVVFLPHSTKPGSWVIIDLHNFKPNSTHAIHIHEYGDMREGCASLGGHYNPHGSAHGRFVNREPFKSDENSRHAGDLVNNIISDKNGVVYVKYFDPLVITPEIIGRSVVIHDGVDDLGLGPNAESLITGNAGGRIACAVIGIAVHK